MSVHPNAARLLAAFAAFGTRDLPALHGLFADDVTWTIPGGSLLAGTYVGLEAILAMLGRTVALTDGTYRAEPRWVIGGDDHVAALYRAAGQRAGRAIDIDQLLLCDLPNDRIATVRALPTDQSAFDSFWS